MFIGGRRITCLLIRLRYMPSKSQNRLQALKYVLIDYDQGHKRRTHRHRRKFTDNVVYLSYHSYSLKNLLPRRRSSRHNPPSRRNLRRPQRNQFLLQDPNPHSWRHREHVRVYMPLLRGSEQPILSWWRRGYGCGDVDSVPGTSAG